MPFGGRTFEFLEDQEDQQGVKLCTAVATEPVGVACEDATEFAFSREGGGNYQVFWNEHAGLGRVLLLGRGYRSWSRYRSCLRPRRPLGIGADLELHLALSRPGMSPSSKGAGTCCRLGLVWSFLR